MGQVPCLVRYFVQYPPPHEWLDNNDIICHYFSFPAPRIRISFILTPQPLCSSVGSWLECSTWLLFDSVSAQHPIEWELNL